MEDAILSYLHIVGYHDHKVILVDKITMMSVYSIVTT